LSAADGTLTLDGERQPEGELELHPNDGLFRIAETTYRGRLRVRAGSEGELEAFNVLPPEDYLGSVVGSEMYSSWPLEALMAQAVAARTFMLYALRARGHLNTTDMAYKGVAGESDPAELATQLTRGIVLTHEGRILPAYFHSACGGRTVPVEEVFAEEPLAPLGGVECGWCRQSPYYDWQARVPAALIAEALGDRGIRQVRSLLTRGQGRAGNARFVVVNGEKRMTAAAFRLAVGPDVVRSTRFSVTGTAEGYLFVGGGYGHGVGLCQWGAHGLAEAGAGWQEILRYYYPDAAVRKLY
jgi:stage II sporulation protein D